MIAAGRCCTRVLVAGLVLVACGARTEPKDEDIGGSGPVGDDPREGGCDVPFVIPFANTEVRGRLKGPSRSDGWCGGEDLDDGAEDTYLIAPPLTTDVLGAWLAYDSAHRAISRWELEAAEAFQSPFL